MEYRDFEIGEVFADSFEIRENLGSGGLGTVYKVLDKSSGKTVAIKIFDLDYVADTLPLKAFFENLRASGKFNQDYCCEFYDAGVHEDLAYVSMEYLEGLSLARLIEMRKSVGKPFSLEEAEPIINSLCGVVAHLDRFAPHASLKPSNIIIQPEALRLTDYGLSRILPSSDYVSVQLGLGDCYYYLAPEYLKGTHPIDRRADVFAIGAILYEMLTGQPPKGTIEPCSKLNDSVSPDFDRVIAQALAESPGIRFATVGLLRRAIVDTMGIEAPEYEDESEIELQDTQLEMIEEEEQAEQPEQATAPAPELVPEQATAPAPPPAPAAAPAVAPEPPPAETPAPPVAPEPPPVETPAPPVDASPESTQPDLQVQGVGVDTLAQDLEQTLSEPDQSTGEFADSQKKALAVSVAPATSQKSKVPVVIVAVVVLMLVAAAVGFMVLGGKGKGLDTVAVDTPPTKEAKAAADPEAETEVAAVDPAAATKKAGETPTEVDATPPPQPVAKKAVVLSPEERARAEADRLIRALDRLDRRARTSKAPELASIEYRSAEAKMKTAKRASSSGSYDGLAATAREATGLYNKAISAAAAKAAEAKKAAAAAAPEPPSATGSGSDCPQGMVLVGAGVFRIGSPGGDPDRNMNERNNVSVNVGAFCIDRFEATRAGGIPLTGVSGNFANSNCLSKGKRLCTEEEWEKACKGPGNRKYPYGNTFNPAKCNTEDENGEDRPLVRIGTFNGCRSGYGVYDMSGNAREWTSSTFSGALSDWVVKGGSSSRPDWAVRCANRDNMRSTNVAQDVGFRCCKDPQ
jgi:eukaryotic-like serine/threonine-protein kinase